MILETLLLLLFSHWLCDYPLQGEFLSKAKRFGPLPLYHLITHSGIQAGGVYLVTNNISIAFLEWALHFGIDHLKNREVISFRTDQTLHIICKLLYILIIIFFF